MLCHDLLCHIMSYYVMLSHIMSCHDMSYHIMLCPIMSCQAAAKVPFGAGSSALGGTFTYWNPTPLCSSMTIFAAAVLGLDVNMGPLSVPVVTEYKVVKIQRSAPSNDDNGAGDLSVSSKR